VSQNQVSGERYYQTQEYNNFENEPQLQGFEDRAESLAGMDHDDINGMQSEQDGGNNIHNDVPVNLNDSEFEEDLM
jgi:hypothetical protein